MGGGVLSDLFRKVLGLGGAIPTAGVLGSLMSGGQGEQA